MQKNKAIAGWVALTLASLLAIIATVARWFPATSTSSNEAIIISSLLAFAAAAFGISAYEAVRKG
jgi:hypothetical protein